MEDDGLYRFCMPIRSGRSFRIDNWKIAVGQCAEAGAELCEIEVTEFCEGVGVFPLTSPVSGVVTEQLPAGTCIKIRDQLCSIRPL